MDVKIINFPETKVVVLEHHGSPQLEYETVRKLIDWRLTNRLHPDRHRSYGVHYVNVGPHVQEHEMITDVYLPLK